MKKTRVSVIIPHVSFSEEIDSILKQCIDSLHEADEFIVVVNDFTGFAKAVNQGLKLATGDYLIVVNNDTELVKGKLEDLLDYTGVTAPKVNGEYRSFGCFFCMPRWVYEKIGGLDERFELYFEDRDLIRRLVLAGIPIIEKPLEVRHWEGKTTKTMKNRDKLSDESAAKFREKWNDEEVI